MTNYTFKINNMKKSITLKQLGFTLISLFITTQLFAQPGNKPGNSSSQDRHEKIEQLKITFITRELNLTSSEAQQFWPVYNEMSDQLKIEKKKQRVIIKSLKTNYDSYSELEFKTELDKLYESQANEISHKKEYNDKIAAIISYKKAAKLLSLEQRFKRELLNKVKSRPAGQKGGRKPQ